eukprot:867913-Prymnesium_polylepis.2
MDSPSIAETATKLQWMYVSTAMCMQRRWRMCQSCRRYRICAGAQIRRLFVGSPPTLAAPCGAPSVPGTRPTCLCAVCPRAAARTQSARRARRGEMEGESWLYAVRVGAPLRHYVVEAREDVDEHREQHQVAEELRTAPRTRALAVSEHSRGEPRTGQLARAECQSTIVVRRAFGADRFPARTWYGDRAAEVIEPPEPDLNQHANQRRSRNHCQETAARARARTCGQAHV